MWCAAGISVGLLDFPAGVRAFYWTGNIVPAADAVYTAGSQHYQTSDVDGGAGAAVVARRGQQGAGGGVPISSDPITITRCNYAATQLREAKAPG